MHAPRLQPVHSEEALRARLRRLLRPSKSGPRSKKQLFLGLVDRAQPEEPESTIGTFLDFLCAALPDGDVYLFGGLIRDMAIFGRAGFDSDIDLVVEGDWSHLERYLNSLGAQKNKFGGYRIVLMRWSVDIWHAKETWAIKKGLVKYTGIDSLTETTVTNWDAILMNWRTQQFVHRANYFRQLVDRELDIVLEDNPNPVGMAVRVFRHFCQKDATRISAKAAQYLSKAARDFDFDTIRRAELDSFGNSVISEVVHRYFLVLATSPGDTIEERFGVACALVERELDLHA